MSREIKSGEEKTLLIGKAIEIPERTEGWGNLINVRQAHYFRNAMTICRKWMGNPVWESYQESGEKCDSGTCKSCWTKRKAEEVKP